MNKDQMKSKWLRYLTLIPATALAAAMSAAYAAVPTPTVTQVPSVLGSDGNNYTFFASDLDLSARGFVEEEFFYSGTANSYDATVGGGVNNRNFASPTANVVTSGNAYKSRLIVRRPTDPEKFNGKVVVEWLNATSNWDLDALWQRNHEFFMREGYVWVGITAQNAPVTHATLGLKAFSPARYNSLDLTAGGKFTSGDPLSFDIYAQGIQAVRNSTILGPLKPKIDKIIAAGVSQSAGRVSVFLNAIQTRDTPVVDGALLYIGGEKLRTDLNLPVMKLLSETEIGGMTNEIDVIQPDFDYLRTWQLAGTSHAEWSSLAVRYALTQRDQPSAALHDTCASPTRSRIPDRIAIASAIDWLGRWNINTQVIATKADPITLNGNAVVRDSYGNVLGGLRLAPFAVPVATDTGYSCSLNGTHVPFTTEVLKELYPTRDSYQTAFRGAVEKNVEDGYVLRADADEMLADAQGSIVGMGLACGPLCENVSQFPLKPSTQLLRDHTKFLYLTEPLAALKALDAATLAVARGDTENDHGKKILYFSHAVKWLQQYQTELESQRSKMRMTAGQAELLTGYANTLINELQALGASPTFVTLDQSFVTDLYGTSDTPSIDDGESPENESGTPPASNDNDSGNGGSTDPIILSLLGAAALGMTIRRRRRIR